MPSSSNSPWILVAPHTALRAYWRAGPLRLLRQHRAGEGAGLQIRRKAMTERDLVRKLLIQLRLMPQRHARRGAGSVQVAFIGKCSLLTPTRAVWLSTDHQDAGLTSQSEPKSTRQLLLTPGKCRTSTIRCASRWFADK